MGDHWNAAMLAAWTKPVPVPDGAPPPYYVCGPYDRVTDAALTKIGWLKASAYGPYVAPDGRPVRVAHSCADLICGQPHHGTLFVYWGGGQFHRDARAMLDIVMLDPLWTVRTLPTR